MSFSMAQCAALAGAGLLGLTATAAGAQSTCFLSQDWQGWTSPSPDVIYLRVRLRDVYKVELSAGSSQLQSPGVHLVSIVRGSSNICSATGACACCSPARGTSVADRGAPLSEWSPQGRPAHAAGTDR